MEYSDVRHVHETLSFLVEDVGNRIRRTKGTPEEMARLSASEKAPDLQAIGEELATIENTIAWYTLYRDELRLEEETLEIMLDAGKL